MKSCNQVAHVILPHPLWPNCQNASLMTEDLARLEGTMMGRTLHVVHEKE